MDSAPAMRDSAAPISWRPTRAELAMPVVQRRILFADGESVEAELEVSDGAPWTIRAEIPRLGAVTKQAPDLFEALAEVRTWLAARDAVVLVQGAARDVYPSGMAREAGGRMAYRFRDGKPATRADIVDILAPAEPGAVANVAEQRENFESWIRSLKA